MVLGGSSKVMKLVLGYKIPRLSRFNKTQK